MSESRDMLLAKWLSGQINEEELKLLQEEFDMNYLEKLLHSQEEYTAEVIAPEQMWQAFQSKVGSQNQNSDKSKRSFFVFAIIALLLSMLGIWAYQKYVHSSYEHIQTKEQHFTPMALLDGSEIIIGPQSEIKYSASSWSKERALELDGQAFFKVKKGVPFSVQTRAGKVEVLGTQFDVWSISQDYMDVRCLEGHVLVSDSKGNSKELFKNQSVSIRNGNIQEVADAKLGQSWRENFRGYQTIPVSLMLKDLERFYPAKLSLDKSGIHDVFTGILPTDDLDKCIEFIEASLSYESKRNANKILFTKE